MAISSILPTYNRAPLSFVKGAGVWLEEADGRRFLDMGAGIAVNVLGHANPELSHALKQQADTLWHVSNLYEIPAQKALADKLVAETFADTVFFTNSGTESCELAVKMARKYWHDKGHKEKVEIITFEGCFHGRSSAAIAASGSEKMTAGFGPLLAGFKHLPFDDWENVAHAITDQTAAILIEPIQGEGGIRVVPNGALQKLREIADQKNCLLIFDEVQCGVGRTGKLFAHEHAGVSPDIMMVAKGIGGGFPLGAVLASEDAASGMIAGTHGSTYGGNPLGCAVGSKVLEITSAPAFLEQVQESSKMMVEKLEDLTQAYPKVFARIDAAGLMIGLKMNCEPIDFVKAGYDNGILTVPASDQTVRLLPALNITKEEILEAVERIKKTAFALNAKL